MSQDDIKTRVEAQSDDEDLNIHAILRTGEDDNDISYYLVICEKRYEGREYLKIRYFAAHATDPSEDTWMKNGISIRTSDELHTEIRKALALAAKGAPPEATTTKDLTDTVPK